MYREVDVLRGDEMKEQSGFITVRHSIIHKHHLLVPFALSFLCFCFLFLSTRYNGATNSDLEIKREHSQRQLPAVDRNTITKLHRELNYSNRLYS